MFLYSSHKFQNNQKDLLHVEIWILSQLVSSFTIYIFIVIYVCDITEFNLQNR